VEQLLALTAVALAILLPVLYDGIERKTKAILQSRVGPPLHQSLLDLGKLLSKEPVEFPSYPLVFYTTVLSIILEFAVILVLNIAVLGINTSLLMPVAIALVTVAQTANISMPLLVSNPYSQIGGMREVMLALVNEFSLVAGLALFYYYTVSQHPSSIMGWVIAMPLIILVTTATYVLSGRAPFDIAEAEVELASGVLIELSGRVLALYLYSIYLKRYVSSMLAAVVVFTLMPLNPLTRFILVNVSIPFIWILYSITSVMLGRSRIDLAPGTLFKVYIVLLTISITGLLVIK